MTVMKDVSIAKSEYLDGEKAITKIQDFWYNLETVRCFKYFNENLFLFFSTLVSMMNCLNIVAYQSWSIL
jgi:hypothetical protein